MNNKRMLKYPLLSFGLIALATSCLDVKNSNYEKQQLEDQKLSAYITQNYPGLLPTATGLYYISETNGTGDTPGDNDFAIIRYKGWSLDGLMFDSTDSSDQSTAFSPWFKLGGPFKYNMNVNFPGLNEALKKMKEGGKSIAIMPSVLAYNDYVPRKFEIQLIKVIHNVAAYERQLINDFVASKGKALADSTASGIYYTETQQGGGATPTYGQVVYVQYKGMLTDGRIFDQSATTTDLFFTIGANTAIAGFEEAVKKMQKGTKATVVIPYYRGYDADVRYNLNRQIVIPWYSTLVFDIQLNNIQ